MSDKIAEQAEKSASQIGKFNTAEDLLAAYNALESEFTKRCQLIKQLQTELDSLKAQEQPAEKQDDMPLPENDVPVPEAQEAKAQDSVPSSPPDKTLDVLDAILQNVCDYADVLSTIPEVMSACIARYKQRLIRPYPSPAPAGLAVIVPSDRPRTLSDAKRLADALLNG